jgi:hypothetical protein
MDGSDILIGRNIAKPTTCDILSTGSPILLKHLNLLLSSKNPH